MNLHENILRLKELMGVESNNLVEQNKPTPPIPPLRGDKTPLPASSTYVNKNVAGYADFTKERTDCVKNYNKTTLTQAVNWWKDWLKSPITLNKFAKNWKISTNEASEIFKDYDEALSNLKFQYYSDPNSKSIAYVIPATIMGYSPFKGIIYVNCAKNTEDPLGILIHEIQHILYNVKPFHPKQKIDVDLKIDRNKKESIWTSLGSLFGSETEARQSELTKAEKDKWYKYASDLKGQGVKRPIELINRYFELLGSNQKDYMDEDTEVLSRLYGIRSIIGIKPGQDITVRDFVKLVNDGDVNAIWIMLSIIKSGQTIQNVLNRFNLYAKTNTSNNQTTTYNV